MEPWVWQTLITILSASAGALGGSLLGLRRFRAERWWDLKLKVYQEALDALHVLKIQNDFWTETYFAHRNNPPESELEDRAAKYRAASAAILRLRDVAAFVVDERTREALKLFGVEMNQAGSGGDYAGLLDDVGAAIARCQGSVTAEARRDLSPPAWLR